MAYPRPHDGVDDGWPWNCTRCGRTVYHDDLVCRECDRTDRTSTTAPSPRVVRSWVAWMRRQSYPGFVTRVTTIAGIELALTALWMRVLFSGAVSLPV